LTNQKQELPVAAMCVYGSGQNEQFYGGPPIDASYQDLIHLAKRFQRRRIFETDQSEKSMSTMFVNGSGQNEQTL
jgi:hypothetical protein